MGVFFAQKFQKHNSVLFIIFEHSSQIKMQFLENIKDYFGNARLTSLLAKQNNRKVIFCNLNQAKSIGLIYELKDESDQKRLLNFIKVLKGDFGVRNVKSLAFYNEKEEEFFLQSKLSFNYFLASDLNWRREPLKNECKTFADEQFDILIDLTDEFSIPLRSILLSSNAKFKVGKFNEINQSYYDFMIESETLNFNQFKEEIIRYLTMINAK